MLFPGPLRVNSDILLAAQFLRENLESLDADVRSLTIHRFFLAGDPDVQTPQAKPTPTVKQRPDIYSPDAADDR